MVKTRVQEGELIEKKQGTSSSRLSLFGKAGDQTMHSAKPFSGATFFNLLNNHNEKDRYLSSFPFLDEECELWKGK